MNIATGSITTVGIIITVGVAMTIATALGLEPCNHLGRVLVCQAHLASQFLSAAIEQDQRGEALYLVLPGQRLVGIGQLHRLALAPWEIKHHEHQILPGIIKERFLGKHLVMQHHAGRAPVRPREINEDEFPLSPGQCQGSGQAG